MIKVIELRKTILTSLKTIHPRVYFQDAPDDAIYPYLVYDLPNSITGRSLEQFVLDVDGWDNSTNTTILETLMDDADKALDRKTIVVNNELAMSFYLDNRLALIDDDPRLKRRKYIYQVRTYHKEVV